MPATAPCLSAHLNLKRSAGQLGAQAVAQVSDGMCLSGSGAHAIMPM